MITALSLLNMNFYFISSFSFYLLQYSHISHTQIWSSYEEKQGTQFWDMIKSSRILDCLNMVLGIQFKD